MFPISFQLVDRFGNELQLNNEKLKLIEYSAPVPIAGFAGRFV